MKTSKLETYIDALRVLALKGSLKISSIACELNIDCQEMRRHLDFLLNQCLIDEYRIGSQRSEFSITQRGIAVLKYFKELKQEQPVIEETSIT